MSQRKTTEQFILESRKIHGDRYDYSLVEYRTAKDKVTIICPDHGQFSQEASSHRLGRKCLKCGHEDMKNKQRKNSIKFIEEVSKIHNNKYDYSLVEYINSNTKLRIICPDHGEFTQIARGHYQSGCMKCGHVISSSKQSISYEDFLKRVKEIHGDKYDYSLVEYKNMKTKIRIQCNKCKFIFERTPENHILSKKGCPRYIGKYKTTSDIIKEFQEVHGDKYDYSLVEYKIAIGKVKIKCMKCLNIFEQASSNHRKGVGCPSCNNKTEGLVYGWLQSNYSNVDREVIFEDLPNARFDFYLEDYDLVIELDGAQHFRQVANWDSPESTQAKDKAKMDFCLANNISMIRLLQEDVYGNKYNWQLLLEKKIRNYSKPVILMYEWGTQYDIYGKYAFDYTGTDDTED